MSLADNRHNERMVRLGRVHGKITNHPEDKRRKGESFDATVTNVSALGLGIETEADLPDTTLLALVVELEDVEGSLKFKLDGEVRWRTPPGTQGLHKVGILLLGRPRRHFNRWQEMIFSALRNRLHSDG
jgi:hypothetical protein